MAHNFSKLSTTETGTALPRSEGARVLEEIIAEHCTHAAALGGSLILRLPQVKALCGLSRSSIYLRIADGSFPKPVSLGGRAVGFPSCEIAALNAARIAGKSNAEVCNLIATMEAARTALA